MIDDPKQAAEWASIGQIREWPKNPKPHPDRNVQAIARSISRFGFIDPLTVWRSKGWIAAGHGRARAAALLMREDAGRLLSTDAPGPGMVPVRFVEFASESEFAAYAIADNRLAEVNPMDGAAVADLLQEIADAGGDVDIPGYEEAEIAAMLEDAPDGTGGEDEGADAPPVEAVSRTGEVYELGPHRLVCGDCRDAGVWTALNVGNDYAIHADPPYGIDLLKSEAPLGKSAKYRPVIGDDRAFDPSFLIDMGRETILWGANHYANRLPNSDRWLVWDKQGGAKTTSFSDCELAWCSAHGPARHMTHVWDGFRRDSEKGVAREHPNQKPVAVIEWALSAGLSTNSAVVVEPFGGSGTTLIACAKTGRIGRVIEIDPRYCDVIRRRWTKYALSAGVDPGPGRLD